LSSLIIFDFPFDGGADGRDIRLDLDPHGVGRRRRALDGTLQPAAGGTGVGVRGTPWDGNSTNYGMDEGSSAINGNAVININSDASTDRCSFCDLANLCRMVFAAFQIDGRNLSQF